MPSSHSSSCRPVRLAVPLPCKRAMAPGCMDERSSPRPVPLPSSSILEFPVASVWYIQASEIAYHRDILGASVLSHRRFPLVSPTRAAISSRRTRSVHLLRARKHACTDKAAHTPGRTCSVPRRCQARGPCTDAVAHFVAPACPAKLGIEVNLAQLNDMQAIKLRAEVGANDICAGGGRGARRPRSPMACWQFTCVECATLSTTGSSIGGKLKRRHHRFYRVPGPGFLQ